MAQGEMRLKRVARCTAPVLLAAGFAFLAAPTHSEQFCNLEIVFKKTFDDWEDSVNTFGDDICGVGDVNADGYDDVAASAWDLDSPGGWRSMVYVFFGGNPMDTVPDVILRDTYWGGSGWTSLAGGDVNGDEFSDIIVGLPYGPGNVDVYFGGDPMDTAVDLVLTEPFPESFFGCDVSTGDVNGDGYCDIIASDYDKDDGEGAVYVFYGGPQLDNIPDITLRGHGREGFGSTVGSGGDVNDDGYDDIVVGAWGNSDRFSSGGKIYVYYGGNPTDTVYDVGMYGEGTEQCLGWEPVSIARGAFQFDYIIAGTQFWPHGFPAYSPGKIYVLFGGDPTDSIPDVCVHGQSDTTELGPTACAGDVDGDGTEDLVAGARADSGGVGAVYLWLAHTMKMDTIPVAWMKGDSIFAEPGWRVSSAGDIDGDGRDEIMTSNYANHKSYHTVWVLEYTGTGVNEASVSYSVDFHHLRLTCSPNPFSNSTTITLWGGAALAGDGRGVLLGVYDVAGTLLRTLEISGRSGQVVWHGNAADGNEAHSGVYFIKAISSPEGAPTKVVLVK